jgi:hypothetical protein
MKKTFVSIDFLRIAIVFILSGFTLAANAQSVAINTTGSAANNSAMLDISSTNKGFLSPRMTTAQRTAIVSPADGLLVFDTDTKTFWYFSNTWKEINLNGGGGGSFSLPYAGTGSNPTKLFSISNYDSSNGTAAVYGRSGLVGAGITPGVNIAVWGDNYRGAGVLGSSVNGIGTSGFSFQNHGVYGYSTNNSYAGIFGSHANDGVGVWGETSSSNGGKAIYGKSTGSSGFAGYFESTDVSNLATT